MVQVFINQFLEKDGRANLAALANGAMAQSMFARSANRRFRPTDPESGGVAADGGEPSGFPSELAQV
jgi:hypothetical protein